VWRVPLDRLGKRNAIAFERAVLDAVGSGDARAEHPQ
jgi:hypothetical protein